MAKLVQKETERKSRTQRGSPESATTVANRATAPNGAQPGKVEVVAR